MTDYTELAGALRRDAGDYATAMSPDAEKDVIYTWDQRNVRSWDAAEAIQALVAENETLLRAQQEQWHENDVSLKAENDALQAQLDGIRAALTKDRVIMVSRHNGYSVEDYSNPLVPVKAIETVLGVSE